ncbi:MAG: DMT family transporter [Paracoccaceae bacterium]|nr:DMT family transporter [Paracoccaceae bacterium]MDG1802333.1 DMT family transporter [Paracoccaceae bacterium]
MSDNSSTQATISILGGMMTLGLIDNFVRLIAVDAGLWQFHAVRAVMALAIMGGMAALGWATIRPKRKLAVLGRSVFTAGSMLIYFGCLAFLPIGVVAAGLFTSPIFILLISIVFMGVRVGPLRWLAVAIGFVGVMMVIQPNPNDLDWLSFLPIGAGVLYAIGAVATRAWCEGETTLTLTAGFFGVLGVFGVIGLTVLTIWPMPVADGTDGFVTRSFTPLTGTFLFWTTVQAIGSMVGVGLLFRGYLLGDASYVSVLEYSLMIFASFWAWVIWSEGLNLLAMGGVVMIIISGGIISVRSTAK